MGNCRPQIPNYVSPDCSIESGRLTGLAFIHKDIHTNIYNDPSNATLWVDGNYAADLHVFQEVRGSYTATATEVPGLGSQANRVINSARVIQAMVQGIKNNEGFWDNICLSNEYRVAAVVGGAYDLLFINNRDVQIWAFPAVEDGLDTEALWNVTINWQEKNNMRTSNVPTGIFN